MSTIALLFAMWALAATVLLVRQRARTETTMAALYDSERRYEQVRARRLRLPLRGGAHYPLRRPQLTPAQPRPLPLGQPAPFPDPPSPTWQAFADWFAGIEQAAA